MKIWRGLIIADISLVTAQLLLFFVETAVLETAVEEVDGPTEGGVTGVDLIAVALFCAFLVPFVGALIGSWVGLFNFRPWSRWLYLGITVGLSLLTIPISAFEFSYCWELPSAVEYFEGMVSGTILAIAFLSPLAKNFAVMSPVEASQCGSGF